MHGICDLYRRLCIFDRYSTSKFGLWLRFCLDTVVRSNLFYLCKVWQYLQLNMPSFSGRWLISSRKGHLTRFSKSSL